MADPFTLQVNNWIRQFDEGAEQAMRGATTKLWAAIIKGSPVDEGRFRGNWFPSDSSPSSEVSDNTDKSGANTITRATNSVISQSSWVTFSLTNNLPYSEVIEFGGYPDGPNTTGGYSKQAPSGVVRTNIQRFNNLLENEARRTLPK